MINRQKTCLLNVFLTRLSNETDLWYSSGVDVDYQLSEQDRCESARQQQGCINEYSCARLEFRKINYERFLWQMLMDICARHFENSWHVAIHTSVRPVIRMYTSECSSPPSPPDRNPWQYLKCEYSTLDCTLSALTRANMRFSTNFHRHA